MQKIKAGNAETFGGVWEMNKLVTGVRELKRGNARFQIGENAFAAEVEKGPGPTKKV